MKPITKVCLTLIVAISAGLAISITKTGWQAEKRLEQAAPVDTLAVIERILAGGNLPERWPGAAKTMLRLSHVFEIDPYLLPAVARCENPNPKYFNPCGMTYRGKIVQYESYTYGVYRAAELLCKLKPIYDTGDSPNIESLSLVWCPVNAKQWTRNMIATYTTALEAEGEKGE